MSAADDLARRVAEAMLAREGTGPAWGIEIEDAREGYARIRMTLRNDMLNGHRTAHGGMIFALADTAFAYACNSRNETTVAQSATIAFLGARSGGRYSGGRGAGTFAVRPERRLPGQREDRGWARDR